MRNLYCDDCKKFVGEDYHSATQRARVVFRYVYINDRHKGRIVGERKVPAPRAPDIVCFDCIKNRTHIEI